MSVACFMISYIPNRGVLPDEDPGRYDERGNLQEQAAMSWPEAVDYLFVKAAGKEADWDRSTTRPLKEAIRVMLTTLCEEVRSSARLRSGGVGEEGRLA